ncbi:MAG: DUF2157 domain-containing protein [Betaproteobacteria bacterium]|nr:DUF2157 domain-containing protein [Betaproteobacteria bacterium]
MANPRDEILDWVEQGRLAPQNLRRALDAAAVLPSTDQWRRFLDRLLAFMGVVLLAAGVIFFFAYNWNELGRFAKFGLVEAPILVTLVFVWRLGLGGIAGKAALLLAALLTGALLALVGQTYQTGADTFELFALWAAAILPWALLARFPAFWVLWLALANLALALYFLTFGLLFGMLFAPAKLLWLLFALDTAALVLWEALAASGIEWLRERWSLRILATASGAMATALAMSDVLGWRDSGGWGALAWLAWLAAAYAVYRRRIKDVYVLAGGVLSIVVVITTLLARHIRLHDAGSFLFIGLVVIGLSAAGGWWLTNVANEEERS